MQDYTVSAKPHRVSFFLLLLFYNTVYYYEIIYVNFSSTCQVTLQLFLPIYLMLL